MTNIFIGIAQNQVYNFQNLIKQLGKKSECNILITSEAIKYDSTLFKKVIISGKTFNNNATTGFEKLKSILYKIKNYNNIVKQLQGYKEVKNLTLYFCYIEDVLTNHLFFSFNKNIKGVVMEDGILNYYSHTINNVSKLTFKLKCLLAYIYGLRMKYYKGHSSGIDYDKVVCQYVRIPNLTVCPSKSKQLHINQIEIQSLTNSVLIIGQEPLENSIGSEAYYKRIAYLLTKIKRLKHYTNIDVVYYKPHRNGKKINESFLRSILDEKKLVFLEATASIEELYFFDLKSKFVFGFNSSAAINIYMGLKETTRQRVSFNVFLEKNDTLKEVFTQLKFNILHL